jgi:hypothetical protein
MVVELPTRPRPRKTVGIGPGDDGRRMSLSDFDRAVGEPVYSYELGNEVIEASELPSIRHGAAIDVILDVTKVLAAVKK